MRIILNILRVIIIFSFLCKSLYSHAQGFTVDIFTIENGLSQTGVNCLIQDSRGFIWIGTQDGLNKFDGYSFLVFKNEPSDSNSISSNFINCIFEDRDNNIWIGTNSGLNKYDVFSDKYTRYLTNLENTSIKEDEVFAIYQDKVGYIWIKTENYLSRLNPRTGKFRHYEHYNDIFNFPSVDAKFSIFEDHKNQLWVGTKDGLNYFDRKLEIFKRYRHDPQKKGSLSNDKVKVIYEDKNRNLWIGTENGLNEFDWETETFFYFSHKENNTSGLSNNIINDICEDNRGGVWIATDNGLNEFDFIAKRNNIYNRFVVNNKTIMSVSFNSVIQDKTGIIWAGSKEGLFKIRKKWNKFKLYDKAKNGDLLFGNNYITSIYKKDNDVWVGTLGSGLYIYNLKGKHVKSYNTNNSKILNNYIHKIYEDKNGGMWIGTQDGLCFFDKRKNVFLKNEKLKVLNIFKNNRIFDIEEDNHSNLWVGSKYGLHKIGKDSVQSFYHSEEDTTSLADNLIYDIQIDEKENLWIATKKGLNKIDLSSNKQYRYQNSGSGALPISSNEILCIHKDPMGDFLWLGTVAGLNKVNINTRDVEIFKEKDGLPNNMIYSILSDKRGNLWMSTNRGISRFSPYNEIFTNFSIVDGLQDFEFNHGASFKTENDEFFFGGISGLNSFFSDSVFKNKNIPKIEITSVEILSENMSAQVIIGKNKQVEIPYQNNLITIEFAVLDFTNPDKNKYAYKLEGIEDEWINLGNRRYATFSNLSPGKYVFKVKGSNSENVWNNEGVDLKLIVSTPLWKTDLANIIYLLLLVSFIIWVFRYRTRSLRRSNQELKEKELIAKQVAKQKEELSVKNKNITDSIIYAKRIQEALMPSMKLFQKILPNSFILHKAKDIVSGDFYWINEKNDKIFIAIVDCTGHGVPGAFMSIIGFELLRNITDEHGIDEADKILKYLNNGVATTFGKSKDNVKLKDGMDIAFCVIDKKKSILEFAGAFRPLYFIRDNKIEEIRGDRFSVGLLNENENMQINKTQIKLQKDDIFYLFTDGYADQFGGPEGKKYKYRRFRHLLLTIHKLPLNQQLTYFERSFEDWKGEHEQVDDVLILGFKPDL